jgi:predicted transcriptional regulator
MDESQKIKEAIKEVLLKHPEGVHLLGLAKLVGAHRHTVTKYVHELIGAGIICQKEIGTVKICQLSPKFVKIRISVKKGGKVRR